MIKRDIPRKLIAIFLPKLYSVRDIIWGEFYPFIVHKIKQHEDNLGKWPSIVYQILEHVLDDENPRDYVDYLILENRKNEDIGYHAIAGSILHSWRSKVFSSLRF